MPLPIPSTATNILRALQKSGELPLEDIAKLIPRPHGDHRDFYVFASLVKRGLIDDPFLPSDGTAGTIAKDMKEQLLARKFFAMSSGEKSASYENHTWSIHGNGETLKGQRFALSGLGQLFLDDATTKRFDRAFAIGSGILIGIVVALAAVLIERYAKGA